MPEFKRSKRLAAVALGALSVFLASVSPAAALDYFSYSKINPATPQQGKSFSYKFRGSSSSLVDGGTSVAIRVGPDSVDCALPAADKAAALAGGPRWEWQSVVIGEPGHRAGRFTVADTFTGKPVGDYLICFYITDTATETNSYSKTNRLEFTVASSSAAANCRRANAKVERAQATLRVANRRRRAAVRQLAAARKQLTAAKRKGNAAAQTYLSAKIVRIRKQQYNPAVVKVLLAKRSLRAAYKAKGNLCPR